jgi:hypothetical protein
MKNLKFRKLYLLSDSERKAQKATIDRDVTVVLGANDTGKSHFLKSMYSAFGSDPKIINETWNRASVSLLLEFSVDAEVLNILRVKSNVALFDSQGLLIWSSSLSNSDFCKKISDLFDFTIMLVNNKSTLMIPPPQVLFLPFYQDQDRGWDDRWASFKGVGTLPDYQRSILEYHVGMNP